MGGRIYDASMGRFLQADPIVQSPLDSQSYNRYSYVRNNPMTLTDPSGYSWFSKTWKKLRPYVGLIAMAILVIREWAIASGGNAFLFGAAAGGVSTGSIRGAFIGGITGAIFHQIGSAFDAKTGWYAKDGFGHVFSHALTGGIMTSLQGGKFGHGFFSAGVSKSANINNILGVHPDDAFLRVIVAASIGGTVSKLTGGKFANGAATAGFAQAFNGNQQADDEYQFSLKAELAVGVIKGKMSLDGDLEGQIDFNKNFSYAVNSDGVGTLTQGSRELMLEGLDIKGLGLSKAFKALNLNVSMDSSGNAQFSGSITLIKLGLFNLKLFGSTKTINVSSTIINSGGLAGQAAKSLKSPHNSLNYCKKRGFEC